MKQIVGILILSVMIISCTSESKIQPTNKYFDLKGLIERQIKMLNNQKPAIQKSIIMINSTENQTITTTDWSKELELFIQADLNKPAFVQSYQVDSSSMGVKYTLKENEKLPVKYLNISKLEEGAIGVEALISSDNYLYQTERLLKLSIKKNQLTDYQINGFQKIVFGDRKVFRINGKLLR